MGRAVVTVQAVPFHASASGVDSVAPTAMQKSIEMHDTASSDGSAPVVAEVLGASLTPFHVVPFHRMATVPLSLPMAMHHVGATHETESSPEVPDGSAISCHTPSTNCSAIPLLVASSFTPVTPTPTHRLICGHETLVKMTFGWAPFGSASMCHCPAERVQDLGL